MGDSPRLPPAGLLDHRNGDKADNRIGNLREATQRQNIANARLRRDSKTGVKGVYRGKDGRYVLVIKKNGRVRYTAKFMTLDAAAEVAASVRRRLFGEFANNGG